MPNFYNPDEIDLENPPDDLFIRGLDPVKSALRVAQHEAARKAQKHQLHASLANPRFCPYCGQQALQDGREEPISMEQGDWMGRYGSGREKACISCGKAFVVALWG